MLSLTLVQRYEDALASLGRLVTGLTSVWEAVFHLEDYWQVWQMCGRLCSLCFTWKTLGRFDECERLCFTVFLLEDCSQVWRVRGRLCSLCFTWKTVHRFDECVRGCVHCVSLGRLLTGLTSAWKAGKVDFWTCLTLRSSSGKITLTSSTLLWEFRQHSRNYTMPGEWRDCR